jgi:hypothetical protein
MAVVEYQELVVVVVVVLDPVGLVVPAVQVVLVSLLLDGN